MKTFVLAILFVLFAAPLFAQSPDPPTKPAPAGCLIVKHKGTIGRRLLFTALIGLPIAPGAKYDLVEAVRVPAPKMSYRGKELEALQAEGVHVIVLDTHYKPEELAAARQSCAEAKPAPPK
jgi:hypothetical protein